MDFKYALANFGEMGLKLNFGNYELISYVHTQIGLWESYMESSSHIQIENDVYRNFNLFTSKMALVSIVHKIQKPFRSSLTIQLLRKRHFGSRREISIYLLYRITIRPIYKVLQFITKS